MIFLCISGKILSQKSPPGCRFFAGRGETGNFEVSGRSTMYLDLTRPDLTFLISDLARSSSKTSDERLRVARALLRQVREPAKSIVYRPTGKSTITLRCYVGASYNQATDSGIKFNVRGSISGLMGHNDIFSPVNWKTLEIKRKLSSVKSAELFALDHDAGQLCSLKELYTFSTKLITLTLLTELSFLLFPPVSYLPYLFV